MKCIYPKKECEFRKPTDKNIAGNYCVWKCKYEDDFFNCGKDEDETLPCMLSCKFEAEKECF